MASRALRIGCSVCWLVVGILLIAAGIAMNVMLPKLIHDNVEKLVRLVPNDTDADSTTVKWQKPPFDISMQFWLFETTNADDYLQGAKPAVHEHGPYGFDERQAKFDLDYDTSKPTVFYLNNKTYVFNPSKSCATCDLNDTFTIPNPMFSKIAQLLALIDTDSSTFCELMGIGAGLAVSAMAPPFVTKTARELIFEGYDDPLLDMLSSGSSEAIKKILKLCIPDGPEKEKFFGGLGSMPDKIGLFYGKNYTDDGNYTVNTGMDDVKQIGQILEWKGNTTLPEAYWTRKDALEINGTDGTLYRPFLDEDDVKKLDLFVSDICRSIYVERVSKAPTYDGIDAYHYSVPPEVFNSSLDQNYGFCVPMPFRFYEHQDERNVSGVTNYCLPSGLLDVSNCQIGNPPVVISSPHLLYSSEDVLNSVDGIHPNIEEHETMVELEATTGVGLKFSRRLQINIAMYGTGCNKTITNCTTMPSAINMKSAIIPVLWINESASIDDDSRHDLLDDLIYVRKWGMISTYIAIGLGALCIVVMVVVNVVVSVRKRREVSSPRSSSVASLTRADELEAGQTD